MGEVIRVSACVLVGTMAAMLLQKEKPQFHFMIGLALGLAVLGVCMQRIRQVTESIMRLKDYLGAGSGQLGILVKVLGITYVCEFSAGVCQDAGHGFLAGQLETLGKLSVMASGLAILGTLIDQIMKLA